MDSLVIPVQKIEYVSFDKENYENTVYNHMSIQLKSGDNLMASLSFGWKEEDDVPTALLDFVVQSGLDITLLKS